MGIKLITANKLLFRTLFLVLSVALVTGRPVTAQTDDEEGWSLPINLSRSGSSDTPVMVSDIEGNIHVVWQDTFDGPVYTKRVDGEWSSPQVVDVPWEPPEEGKGSATTSGSYVPTLTADSVGKIHAFWVGEENGLYYSNSSAEMFADQGWSTPRLMDESVIGFNAIVDNQDRLHLAYMRSLSTEDKPTAIYYQVWNPVNALWEDPVALYESNYFRSLTLGEVNINMLTLGGPDDESENNDGADTERTILVSWDNRIRKELLLIRSGDSGETWDAPYEVAVPDDNTDTVIPNSVGLIAFDNKALLVWKEVEAEITSNCTQYFQVFTSEGQPETDPRPMLDEIPSCPLETQTLFRQRGRVFLQTTIFGETYLLSWDGSRWSLPQVQPNLSNFFDSDTFHEIRLKCLRLIPVDTEDRNEIFIVGCDPGGSEDIWFTGRTLGEVSDWFAKPSVWTSPALIVSSAGEISPVSLTAGNDGLLHAVWAQAASRGGDKSIYYARWNGESWTHIIPIIQPPFGKVNHLITTIDPAGRMFVVWSGGEAGEIYLSWVNANLAGNASEWISPVPLPMPNSLGSTPDIAIGDDNKIFVVYAVPINEERGIYLTQSEDNGRTWSDPLQVFDAVTPGWEYISQPSLGITLDGNLHIMFLRYPPPDGIASKVLYYSRSEDGGLSWSTPEEVASAEVTLGQVGSLNEEDTIRFWQEVNNNDVETFLEISTDDGSTWLRPVDFIELASKNTVSDIVLDNGNSLHLVQLSVMTILNQVTPDELVLQEWIWNGTRWLQAERQKFGPGSLTGMNSIAASITSDGHLGVLFAKLAGNDPTQGMALVFTERILDDSTFIEPTPTPTSPTPETGPGMETTETPIVTSTQTPTPQTGGVGLPGQQEEGASGSPASGMTFGIVAGFVSAGLVVRGTLFIFNRLIKRNR